MNWICIRTVNKKEKKVSKIIRDELGLETFSPEISRLRKYRTGKRRFTEAMFPCYLFVKLDVREGFERIRSTRGVHSILKYGMKVSVVSEKIIYKLKESLSSEDVLFLDEDKPGISNVGRIEYGPFEGFVGEIIKTSNAGERVCVLLNFLGHCVPVEVPAVEVSVCEPGLELAS
ncbi:hypothetical protein MLD52_11630 [Puniceicoccaceae bacterium K14]|nr:hypothetical protein [Puniceicoccaceae bacterium K14]